MKHQKYISPGFGPEEWNSHKHWVADVCSTQSFLKLHYSWIRLNHIFQGSWKHSILLRTIFSRNHGEKGVGIWLNPTQCSASFKHFRLWAGTHVPFLRFQKDLKVMIVRLRLTDILFLNPVIVIIIFLYTKEGKGVNAWSFLGQQRLKWS